MDTSERGTTKIQSIPVSLCGSFPRFVWRSLVLINTSRLPSSAEATRHMQRRDLWHGTPHPVNGHSGTKHTSPHAISPTGIYCGQDGVGQDPRAQRGGNIPPLFFLGHWLRDKRL